MQLNQQHTTTAQAVRMSMETAQFKAMTSMGRAPPSYVQLNMVPSASSLIKQNGKQSATIEGVKVSRRWRICLLRDCEGVLLITHYRNSFFL